MIFVGRDQTPARLSPSDNCAYGLAIMHRDKTSPERAFELARSGACASVGDIRSALKGEGYATTQLEGRTLSRQLGALIRDSRATGDAEPVESDDE